MKPRIIAEAGSCHGGNFQTALNLVDAAKEAGAWAVKFQLFPDTKEFTDCGNIYLPWEWWRAIVVHARQIDIEIFASVWDNTSYDLLKNSGCRYAKFAYERDDLQKIQLQALDDGLWIIRSLDYMNSAHHLHPKNINQQISLFCIRRYPVIEEIAFDGLFPLFDGFSDHTLGIKQTKKALLAGADYIEKHFRLKDTDNCLDAKFAIKPDYLKELCHFAKGDKQLADTRFGMGKQERDPRVLF